MMLFVDVIGWTCGFAVLDNQVAEIERYSDRNKSDGPINRDSLSDFVKLSSSYLPPELFEGVQSK